MGGDVELCVGQGVRAAGDAGDLACQGGDKGGSIGQLGAVEDKDLMVSVEIDFVQRPRSVLEDLEPERRPPSLGTRPLPAYSSPQIPSRLAQYGFTPMSSSYSSVSRSPCRRTATAGPRTLPSRPSIPSSASRLSAWASHILSRCH